jgi:hypothetical protein
VQVGEQLQSFSDTGKLIVLFRGDLAVVDPAVLLLEFEKLGVFNRE